MGIFPIIKGQKPNEKNDIPQYAAKPTAPAAPAEAEPPKEPEQPKQADDLIDFGQSEEPAPQPQPQPPKQPNDIETLLTTTGKPAEGPLIDFAQDMKKGLPEHTK
jgi:hypothetical protein